MKKAQTFAPLTGGVLFLLIPAVRAIAALLGYKLTLYHQTAVLIVITALFLVLTAVMLAAGAEVNRLNAAAAALLPSLSLFNGLLLVPDEGVLLHAVLLLLSFGGALLLFCRFGGPSVLKVFSGITAVLLTLLLLFSFFLHATIGGLRKDTVVKNVSSPSGFYVAQVIDRDQGATGGDTFVQVRKAGGLMDFGIGRLEKASDVTYRAYAGEWGEAESLALSWKDDQTLLVNEAEIVIPALDKE